MMKLYVLTVFFATLACSNLTAQEKQETDASAKKNSINLSILDGTFVAGYVDHGAFINFTGPNLSWTHNKSKLLLGMLPSLRIKEDNRKPKNSLITPTLGVGVTYCYKKIALQLPLYYTPKTAIENGRWNLGIGLGFRLKS
jgi:hypothetical protein